MPLSILRRHLFIILATSFFLFICYVIFAADTGQSIFLAKQVRHLPFGDKAGHFILYGILAFLVNLALGNRQIQLARHHLLLGSVIVTTFAIGEEFTQIFLASRSFELADIMCDLLGIYVFGKLAVRVLIRE